jgi:hypothetical protein
LEDYIVGTLFEIDKAAQDYSRAHDDLAREMAAINDAITIIKRQSMPALRKAVEKAAAKKAALRGLIDESREQFEKPRTRILHGVKLGIVKGKGSIVVDDPVTTIKLIHKNMPDEAGLLLRVTESVNKLALTQLTASDLKKIGARVEETGDQIVVLPTSSEIDKLVDALLSEDEPEAA